MDSCRRTNFRFRWPQASLLFLFSSVFFASIASGSEPKISYSDHCALFVPAANPTALEFTISPFVPYQDGYYSGGDRIFNLNPNASQDSDANMKALDFQTHGVYRTDVEDVFKVEGNLVLRRPNIHYYVEDFASGRLPYPQFKPKRISRLRAAAFTLEGFWSHSTGKLCMVGQTHIYSQQGKSLNLAVVLKLNHVRNSSSLTSLITGTIVSLNSAELDYFDPISLIMFPQVNYNYSRVAEEFSHGCASGCNVPENFSLGLPLSSTICSMFSNSANQFELEYLSGCNSAKKCNPLDDKIGYLPQVMSLSIVQCSENRQSARFLIEFPNNSYVGFYRPLVPNATLVGEGSWDTKKKELLIIACRMISSSSVPESSHVGDCTIRLIVRFPATWSIRNTSGIVGQIWSTKSLNDLGYFDQIVFRNSENGLLAVPGVEYKYTRIDKRGDSCPAKKPEGNRRKQLPSAYSSEMSFDMAIKSSGTRIGWGYSYPLSVENKFISQRFLLQSNFRPTTSVAETNTSGNVSTLLNVSYQMSFTFFASEKLAATFDPFNSSSDVDRRVQITAEGTYNGETGDLCMVGCRKIRSLNPSNNVSMDCEILINIHFPPLDSHKKEAYIRGSIESTRETSDFLYFKPLDLAGAAFYTEQARASIWRIDLEITMALISVTLACVILIVQLLHVKKHPEVLPFISLVMLMVLALGHLIPLVLNFEALFLESRSRKNVMLGTGGWLEMNEVIIRVLTMAAFLLQCRLLQLAWTARNGTDPRKALWTSEKKEIYTCLSSYITGGIIAFFANYRKNAFGTIRAYAGLVLDCFLFPQVISNVFKNSREQALSHFFYTGMTLVRLLPHGYDLYRANNFAQNFGAAYIYADPDADFYSTSWDVIIPVLSLLFAAVIFLQQRFGGRCLLPKKFRLLDVYEKVPTSG